MKTADLTVVVTAHNETFVCGPTMRSADRAIDVAIANGFSVERIIALDAATDGTNAYFCQPDFDHWKHWYIKQGDLGRTRNEVIPRCAGNNIAFLDSDDLFSENWLLEGMKILKRASASGDKLIVHPELNWIFDGGNHVFVKPDQHEEMFTPYYWYFSNYYDSLCMTPKDAHLAVPYVHRDIPNGLSFQDYQFGVETMAAGWRHVTAKDTIIFKRRRDESLVTESSGRKSIIRSLECMAIDRIDELGKTQFSSDME